MPPAYKKVPAIDKCFTILDLLARTREPLGISDISGKLGLNKSTVFNIVHTLQDLNVLENHPDGKFVFGTRIYILGNIAGNRSELIQTAHPYLEMINAKTKLSAFLGIRSDRQSILIDKVDSAYGIKVSSEIGLRMPVLAGPGIKAMLTQLPDGDIDEILARTALKKYTPYTTTDKSTYKKEILDARKQGIVLDREEYIEGMVSFAIPIKVKGKDLQAAIWAVGLTRQVPEDSIPEIATLLKGIAADINSGVGKF
jgi:DNA-binding IclR family transcriptional regulator